MNSTFQFTKRHDFFIRMVIRKVKTVHAFFIRMVTVLRQNIVQYYTWYNHSIRIRYNVYRHTGTRMSACFISRGAIFSRSRPQGRADCLVPLSARVEVPCSSAQQR